MQIHVVQPGDTIESIAEQYEVSVARLIQDNDLIYPNDLVIGQTIVIVYPEQTYIVQDGDSLESIAKKFNVSINQLLKNNPFLVEREYIYPKETLVIRYEHMGSMTTNGFANAYINRTILKKTLPYLTYLSIYNYKVNIKGEVITYYDDTEILEITKAYNVAPLMLLTTLTAQGEENVDVGYAILLNEELQENHINNVLEMLDEKGYYGVNISFQYINSSNIELYNSFLTKFSNRLNEQGYPVYTTINPNIYANNEEFNYRFLDYSILGEDANDISFMHYNWGYSFGPPSPISSIPIMRELVEYVTKQIPREKINIGLQTIGYNWELPYVAGFSKANVLTLKSTLNLARDVEAIIQFDEVSQTPYYNYNELVSKIEHIVWFIDARSIKAIVDLVFEYKLQGTGIWNIMTYHAQLWLIINSQYDIDKVSLDPI